MLFLKVFVMKLPAFIIYRCMVLICHYNDDGHVISTKTQCQDDSHNTIDRHCFNQDCVPNED